MIKVRHDYVVKRDHGTLSKLILIRILRLVFIDVEKAGPDFPSIRQMTSLVPVYLFHKSEVFI